MIERSPHTHRHVDVDHLREQGLDVHRWGLSVPDGVWPQEGPLPVPMYGTTATGLGLAGGDHLGCDLIHVRAGEGFSPHTHPGDHLLIVVAGRGTVTWDGRIWPTEPGMVYFVPGEEPHAVGAVDDHTILAVGAPHRPVGSVDRQTLVAYKAVAAALGRLTCLLCGLVGHPADLVAAGCPHAPEDRLDVAEGRLVILTAMPLDAASQRHLEQGLALDAGTLDDAVDVRSLFDDAATRAELRGTPAAVAAFLEDHPGRVVLGLGLMGAGPTAGVYPTETAPVLWMPLRHPHLWGDADFVQVGKFLPTARTVAAGGPPSGTWTTVDGDNLAAAFYDHRPYSR